MRGHANLLLFCGFIWYIFTGQSSANLTFGTQWNSHELHLLSPAFTAYEGKSMERNMWSRPRSVSSHQQISRSVVICPPAALLELNSWSITQMRCFQHCICERLTAGQQAALILAGAGEIHKLSRRDDVPQLPWGGVFHNTTALKNTQQDFQFL